MRRDEAYFLDILLAARRIKTYTTGLSREGFEQEDLYKSAVLREIQVIGEASRQLSDDAKTAHPQIPWQQIIGMRNRVIHRYFEVDLEILWLVISQEVDNLINYFEPLIRPDDSEQA